MCKHLLAISLVLPLWLSLTHYMCHLLLQSQVCSDGLQPRGDCPANDCTGQRTLPESRRKQLTISLHPISFESLHLSFLHLSSSLSHSSNKTHHLSNGAKWESSPKHTPNVLRTYCYDIILYLSYDITYTTCFFPHVDQFLSLTLCVCEGV